MQNLTTETKPFFLYHAVTVYFFLFLGHFNMALKGDLLLVSFGELNNFLHCINSEDEMLALGIECMRRTEQTFSDITQGFLTSALFFLIF